MIIESLLVVSVAAFHLAVMPRCCRAYRLVCDVKAATKNIQGMNSFCLLCVGKLSAIVCLDHIRCIAEVDDRTLHEIHGAVTAIFLLGVNKPLSGCFFNHSILVEFLTICTCIADNWNIFYIHLPFFTQFCGCIIVP